MALHIGLIHTVETIVIEHRVHLCLAWIVACTHGIHVRLLEHHHVLKHCGYVNRATCHGVCILQVGTLEKHLLAIDIYKTVLYLYVTETVLCREHMLLVAVSVLLRHDNRIEDWCLGTPQLQASEAIENGIDAFDCLTCRELDRNVLPCNLTAVGSHQSHLDVL